MRRFLPVVLLLAGCERLEAVGDLTDPVVAQGLYLGLDVPEGVPLDDAEEFEYAALCNVFLAYVADPSELADAPVEGARLFLRSDANGRLEFREEGDGKYTLDSTDGLVYEVGDKPVISFEQDDTEARLAVLAPEAAEFEVPSQFERESSVEVDLSDYDYQNIIVATYDINRSKLTWDNLPTAVDETYEFTHTEEPVDVVEVPGEAFLRKGPYVIGAAGMQIADPTEFEGVNTSLSAFIAGRLAVRLVSVTE